MKNTETIFDRSTRKPNTVPMRELGRGGRITTNILLGTVCASALSFLVTEHDKIPILKDAVSYVKNFSKSVDRDL